MKIAIVAALPGELKPLVRDWRRVPTDVSGAKKWVLVRGEDTWVAVCAGMGADAARRAFALAALEGPLEMVLSVGWAGALSAEMRPGTVHVPTVVTDAQTGEQFLLVEGGQERRLVTAASVADVVEKRRLAATYSGAVLVDMEAATIARLAAMRDIPLVCIKGVSDAFGANIPDLNPFIDPMGRMRLFQFVVYVVVRPRYWSALIHLGRNSAKASDSMRDLILEFMKEKNVEEFIRNGSV